MDELEQLYSRMRPRNVCICRAVSEATIRQAIQDGATSLEMLKEQTGCATGCGTCAGKVMNLLEDELNTLKNKSIKIHEDK